MIVLRRGAQRVPRSVIYNSHLEVWREHAAQSCAAWQARSACLPPLRHSALARRDYGCMESVANELLAHITLDVADRQLDVTVGNKRGPRKRKGVVRSNQTPPAQVARLKLLGSESKILLSSAPLPYAIPLAISVFF
jgi:hypothetical protein